MLAIMRRIFDCAFCSIAWLDLLVQPQISMSCVQIGFIIVLYIKSLFSIDSCDFLPSSQYNSFTLSSICFLFCNIMGKVLRLETYEGVYCYLIVTHFIIRKLLRFSISQSSGPRYAVESRTQPRMKVPESTWKYLSTKTLPTPRPVHSICVVNYWMWFTSWIEALELRYIQTYLGFLPTEDKRHVVLIRCHKSIHVLWERLMFQRLTRCFQVHVGKLVSATHTAPKLLNYSCLGNSIRNFSCCFGNII